MLQDFRQLLIVEITILLNSSHQLKQLRKVLLYVCVLKTNTEPVISPMYFGATFGGVTSEIVVVD